MRAPVGLLLGALVLGACGGRVGEDAPGDGGVIPDAPFEDVPISIDVPPAEDTPPPLSGLHSYDVKITGVKVTMNSGGPPPPSATSPSEGASFRVDLDPGLRTDGGARLVVADGWKDAVVSRSCCGTRVTFAAAEGGAFITRNGASASWRVFDTWDRFTVVFDTSGHPADGVLTGRTMLEQGDVAWDGRMEATVTFAPDTTRPAWRATSAASFATSPLPWDEHVVETSEPYVTMLDFAKIGPVPPALWNATSLTQPGYDVPSFRGWKVRSTYWEQPMPIPLKGWPVADAAGNVAGDGALKLDSLLVPRRSAGYLRFDATDAAPLFWGEAKVATSGCRPGKTCAAIGPFTQSWCTTGSKGGIATRLPTGGGPVHATVRAVAKRTSTYPGSGTPPNPLAMQTAAPGEVPVLATETLKWTMGTDGTADTGWTTITAKTSMAKETGIAISGGGTGKGGESCYGAYPYPEEWSVTVYVEEIAF